MNASALRLPAFWSARQRFVLSTALLLICLAPALIHQQFVTGPIVNAALLVCAIIVGGPEAAVLGIIPSAIAVVRGTLPAILVPVVPFIAASNLLLVFAFASLYRFSAWGAMLVAALLKFGFLCLVSAFVVPSLVPQAAPVATLMLSWPQLVTALAGGLIALAVLRRRS